MLNHVNKMRRDVKNKNSFTFMNYRIVGLVITVVLLMGLFFFNRKEVEMLKQTNFEWKRITSSAYELSSVIHLHNPNLLSSTIKTIDQRFFINGKQIGELSNAIAQGIPGRKETAFPIKVRIPKSEIPSFYLDSDFVAQQIEIAMKGEIVFENLFGGGKMLIDQKDTVYVTEL